MSFRARRRRRAGVRSRIRRQAESEPRAPARGGAVRSWLLEQLRRRADAVRFARLAARERVGPAAFQPVTEAEKPQDGTRDIVGEVCVEVAALQREAIEPRLPAHRKLRLL